MTVVLTVLISFLFSVDDICKYENILMDCVTLITLNKIQLYYRVSELTLDAL